MARSLFRTWFLPRLLSSVWSLSWEWPVDIGRYHRLARVASIVVLAWSVAQVQAQTFTKIIDTGITSRINDTRSASWGDYNGDGWLDLFISTSGEDELYRNNGDGTFSEALQPAITSNAAPSNSALWVDYDADGDLDLYVSRWERQLGAPNVLYANDGQGNFLEVTDHPLVQDINATWVSAWGDMDNDGDLDVFVPSNEELPSYLYRNDAGVYSADTSVAFVERPYVARTVNWVDYDEDGDLDMFILTRQRLEPEDTYMPLYRNMLAETGEAVFEEDRTTAMAFLRSALPFVAGAWFDYDSDGDLDLYVTNSIAGPGSENQLFENFFGEFIIVEGHPLANYSEANAGLCWGDFDNDGYEDLYVAVNRFFTPRPNRYFQSDEEGQLQPINEPPYTTDFGLYAGCAVADYDNDGDLDLYLTTGGVHGPAHQAENVLYRNDDGNESAWVNIALRGAGANPFAIGARVLVEATISGDSRTQSRYLLSNTTGHLDQSSQRLHVGLGDATHIERITVRWPTGNEETYEDVAINQFLKITEGQGAQPVAQEAHALLPATAVLHPAYPNPVVETTTLSYTLPEAATVRLVVYDSLGRTVQTLEEAYQPAGSYSQSIDATQWATGVYHYRLNVDGSSQTGSFAVMR